MSFSLDKLTYRYFNQDDPHFQQKFTQKQEFIELALPKIPGPIPPRAEFYPHQTLGERYLNIWDTVLLDNEPGTGKTGIIYATAISFDRNKNLSPEEAYILGVCNYIKQTIIIVPNETLEKTWRRAYNKYSGVNILPKSIQIVRRDSFYSKYSETPIDLLIKLFGNSFIAIDEVHELLNRSNAIEKDKYEWYRMLLHVLPNIKVALATGTTIIMNPSELGLTMNLLPDLDMPTIDLSKKVTTADPWWNNVTEKDLAKYIGGRISHLKNVQDKSVLVYPESAVPINELIDISIPTDIQVIPITMSKLQSDMYWEKYQNIARKENPFNVASITRSLSVIPSQDAKDINLYNRKIQSNDEYARKVAIKLFEAVQIAIKRPGIVFIVSRYVETSGNVLEKILTGHGFTEYTVGRGKGKKKISNDLELPNPGKNYIAIRSQAAYNASLVDLVGRYENRYGQYIKIVLTARVGAVGITIRNAQSYIVLDPDTHSSGELQREKRIFRPGSHDDLYYDNIKKGLSHEDAIIKVYAYRLAAIPVKAKISKGTEILVEVPEDSVDLKTYRHNIEGDRNLQRIRTMSNRIAYDSQIQIYRNQCVEDPNEILERKGLDINKLDLTDCYYGFYDKLPKYVDYSTYDLLYGYKKPNTIIKDLISLLIVEGSISVAEFLRRGQYAVNKLGLYKLIFNSLYTNQALKLKWTTLSDYGTSIYIGAIEDTLYLQTDLNFSMGSKIPKLWPETYIYANLMVASRDPIEYHISYTPEPMESIKEFAKWLKSTGNTASIDDKIETIESVIVNYHSSPNPDEITKMFYYFIRARYDNKSIFTFNKPIGRILFMSDAAYDPKVREEMSVLDIKDVHGTVEQPVLLHILHSQHNELAKGKYDIFKSLLEVKQVTVLDTKTATFIRLTPPMAEFYVYSKMIAKIVNTNFNNFLKPFRKAKKAQQKIYGFIYDPSAEFKIYDNRKEVPLTRKGEANKAKQPRGKTCSSYDLEYLVDIAIALEINPDSNILDINAINFDDIKEYKEAKKIIRNSNKLSKIINENVEFYKDRRNYIIFSRWASLYIKKDTSDKKVDKNIYKTPICDQIYLKLQQLQQIYLF